MHDYNHSDNLQNPLPRILSSTICLVKCFLLGGEPIASLPARDCSDSSRNRSANPGEGGRVRECSEVAAEDDRVAPGLARGRVEGTGRGSEDEEEIGVGHSGVGTRLGSCQQGSSVPICL